MPLGSPANVSDTLSPWKSAAGAKPKPVAVCHIASGDLWAGAEKQIATLLKHLVRQDTLSVVAIVLNPGRLATEIEASGIEVKVIPERKFSFLQILSESVRFLTGRNIRILHSHRYKENLLAVLLAWRCRAPFVVRTQHGLPEPHRGWRRLKPSLVSGLDRVVARWATDCVISVSADLTSHLSRSISPWKIVTIPNGIDLQTVRSDLAPQEAKERLGISRQNRVIGTACRLEPVKRLDLFLMAAKQIRQQDANTEFVIAGEGTKGEYLRRLAQSLGIQNQVHFLGHRSDIYDVLRAFDVLVLCSDHEGLPMVLLEALSLGVPVVARGVGGIVEVLQNGVNGVLLDSDDPAALATASVQILSDETLRLHLASEGLRSVAGNFGAERAALSVARTYASLVDTE